MIHDDLSLMVVGAGAIGGITAALLKKKGYNVEIVCRNAEYASIISNEGLEVSGTCGEFRVTVPAYSSFSDVKEKKDIILHATKAYDIAESAKQAMGILKDDGYVISMQNGICEDALAAIFGKDRIIGCITGWGATMNSRGKLIMTSGGDFIIGYPWKARDPFLDDIAGILSSVVPVRITDNILGHLYSKLIINSCVTSLGAICGLYLGKMLSVKKIRRIFIEIIHEAVMVAEAMKIKIEVFGGKLDFNKFIKGNNIFSDMRRHLLIRIIGFSYRKLKSSSLQSLERGRLTEVDYLNGYVVQNGRRLNVPVPVNSAIVAMIHEIEQKKRKISFENFNYPVFDLFND
ncbi:MAG: 2-dehydropantoate 2-reductase [Bacteroidales bacterium]